MLTHRGGVFFSDLSMYRSFLVCHIVTSLLQRCSQQAWADSAFSGSSKMKNPLSVTPDSLQIMADCKAVSDILNFGEQ